MPNPSPCLVTGSGHSATFSFCSEPPEREPPCPTRGFREAGPSPEMTNGKDRRTRARPGYRLWDEVVCVSDAIENTAFSLIKEGHSTITQAGGYQGEPSPKITICQPRGPGTHGGPERKSSSLLVNFFGCCLCLNFSLFSCRNFRTLFLCPYKRPGQCGPSPAVGHGRGPTFLLPAGISFPIEEVRM